MFQPRLAATDHDLTLVIPAYNEARRIGATLSAVKKALGDSSLDYRVLVVDDGSKDDTARQTDSFGRRFSSLRLSSNRGKGAAVRAGVLAATGRVVAFTDADLPFELSSLFVGYDLISQGRCEAVFGARDLEGSSSAASRRLARRLSSAAFRQIVSVLISRDVTDTQCGLKLFSYAVAAEIFSQTTIDGFAFDVEVVYLARRLGVAYRRIPVRLINEQTSTLSLRRHSLPMLADLLKVRMRRYPDLAAARERTKLVEQQPPVRRAA